MAFVLFSRIFIWQTTLEDTDHIPLEKKVDVLTVQCYKFFSERKGQACWLPITEDLVTLILEFLSCDVHPPQAKIQWSPSVPIPGMCGVRGITANVRLVLWAVL